MTQKKYHELLDSYLSTPESNRTVEMLDQLIDSSYDESFESEDFEVSPYSLEAIMPDIANYLNEFVDLSNPNLPGHEGDLAQFLSNEYKTELERELKPCLEEFIKTKLFEALQNGLVPKNELLKVVHKNKELSKENKELKSSLASSRAELKTTENKLASIRKISNEAPGKKDELKFLRKKVYDQDKELKELKEKLKQKSSMSESSTKEQDVPNDSIISNDCFNIMTDAESIKSLKVGFVTAFPQYYDFNSLKKLLPDGFVISSTTATIKKADLIVFLTQHSEHKLTKKIKNYCIAETIPYIHCANSNPNKIHIAIKKYLENKTKV